MYICRFIHNTEYKLSFLLIYLFPCLCSVFYLLQHLIINQTNRYWIVLTLILLYDVCFLCLVGAKWRTGKKICFFIIFSFVNIYFLTSDISVQLIQRDEEKKFKNRKHKIKINWRVPAGGLYIDHDVLKKNLFFSFFIFIICSNRNGNNIQKLQ